MARQKPAPKRTRSRSSKPGRPSKCTPEVTSKVCKAIQEGSGREDAARAAGIGPATFREWMARAAAGEGEYAAFAAAVEEAESRIVRWAGKGLVTLCRSKKTPPAVKLAGFKLILERRRPDVWAPRRELQVSGPDGGPVPLAVSGQVQLSGEVALRPLISREDLRELTRQETEAALQVEFERQQAQNREEEGAGS
jgi:hypothetical protein